MKEIFLQRRTKVAKLLGNNVTTIFCPAKTLPPIWTTFGPVYSKTVISFYFILKDMWITSETNYNPHHYFMKQNRGHIRNQRL